MLTLAPHVRRWRLTPASDPSGISRWEWDACESACEIASPFLALFPPIRMNAFDHAGFRSEPRFAGWSQTSPVRLISTHWQLCAILSLFCGRKAGGKGGLQRDTTPGHTQNTPQTDFGAFVNIGLKENGLIHRSRMGLPRGSGSDQVFRVVWPGLQIRASVVEVCVPPLVLSLAGFFFLSIRVGVCVPPHVLSLAVISSLHCLVLLVG